MKIGFLAVVGLLVGVPSVAHAAELVNNGNFEQGNTGFTTTYDGSIANGAIFITTNPSTISNRFLPIEDHTTGTGNMLAFDGAESGNAIWQETINVVAGEDYTFGFWGHTLAVDNGQIEPVVAATINGVTIGSLIFPDNMALAPDSWSHFVTTFNSGTSTTLTLALSDLQTTHYYNDGALDDISLIGPAPAAAVPEPVSWTMLIVGFGLIGTGVRYRQRRTVLHYI